MNRTIQRVFPRKFKDGFREEGPSGLGLEG